MSDWLCDHITTQQATYTHTHKKGATDTGTWMRLFNHNHIFIHALMRFATAFITFENDVWFAGRPRERAFSNDDDDDDDVNADNKDRTHGNVCHVYIASTRMSSETNQSCVCCVWMVPLMFERVRINDVWLRQHCVGKGVLWRRRTHH